MRSALVCVSIAGELLCAMLGREDFGTAVVTIASVFDSKALVRIGTSQALPQVAWVPDVDRFCATHAVRGQGLTLSDVVHHSLYSC